MWIRGRRGRGRFAKKRRGVKRGVVAGVPLLAGLVCSIGVAWGVEIVRAYRQAGSYPTWQHSNAKPPIRVAADPRDASQTLMYFETQEFGRSETSVTILNVPVGEVEKANHLGWVGLPDRLGSSFDTVAYGWPFRCMKYGKASVHAGVGSSTSFTRFGSGEEFGGIEVDWPKRWFIACLPAQPFYRGLVANTVIYAAVFGFVPWGFVVHRRSRRRRRGGCPFCSYDLRGDFTKPCSVCGKAFVSGA